MENQNQQLDWRDVSQFKKPKLPIEIFPKKIQDLLIQYHESSGCPVDYAACVITSTVIASVFDRFSIQAKFGRIIPVTLYQFVIGGSGTMKSAPFNFFSSILNTLTTDANRIIAENNTSIDNAIADLKVDLKNAEPEDADIIKEQIAEMVLQKKPFYPRIVTDATLEALAVEASKCRECVSVFSSEGNMVNVVSGLSYAQKGSKPNIDHILHGFDAEHTTICRIGKEAIVMDKPRICICIGGQKRTLDTLTRVGEQAERGFPNRCLFYYPEPIFDHDALNEKPVAKELVEHWEKLITALFQAERGNAAPIITVDESAIHKHDEYRNLCMKRKEKARYSGEIQGWIGKQADKALRFAAILMLMDNPKARRIKPDDLERSINFFEQYAFPMALVAYGMIGNELTDEQSEYMETIKRIQTKKGECTLGLLTDAYRRWDKKEFFGIVNYLKDNDYIRIEEVKTTRKPYKRITVNPYYQG